MDNWWPLISLGAGLAGTALGGGLAIWGESRRWAREREARLHDHRQQVLLAVLRYSNLVIAESGLAMEATAGRRASVLPVRPKPPDTSEVDQAVIEMTRSIEELFILGPHEVHALATDLFEVAMDVRQAVADGEAERVVRELAERVYRIKVALRDAAGRHGLADAASAAAAASSTREVQGLP